MTEKNKYCLLCDARTKLGSDFCCDLCEIEFHFQTVASETTPHVDLDRTLKDFDEQRKIKRAELTNKEYLIGVLDRIWNGKTEL